MNQKKKICAGFDGNEHEAYIYKNIGGKKYCKSCTYKLQPPKQINKVSEKQVFKIRIKKDLLEEDKKFYNKIWEERYSINVTHGVFHQCECCGKTLPGEPNLMYFHHILEKRNYPEYRHRERNIAIVCPDCHSSYESNPDNQPYLKYLKQDLLDAIETIGDIE